MNTFIKTVQLILFTLILATVILIIYGTLEGRRQAFENIKNNCPPGAQKQVYVETGLFGKKTAFCSETVKQNPNRKVRPDLPFWSKPEERKNPEKPIT